MPHIETPSDELLLAEVYFRRSARASLLRLSVTDHAMYLAARREGGGSPSPAAPPLRLERVPLSDIEEVRIQTVRPYGAYLLALLLIAAGGAATWSLHLPSEGLSPRGLLGALAGLCAVLLLSMAGRSRHRLVIRGADHAFHWVPPVTVRAGSRRQVNETLDTVTRAARATSLRLVDDRAAREAA